MRLTWIKLEGLYDRFNHTVELKEDGLTIIHSPNGLGKSTLVRMICLAFGGRWDELQSIPFERLEFGFDEERKLVFLMDERLEVKLIGAGDNIPMSRDEVESMQEVLYLGPQRLFLEEQDGRFVSALDAYSERVVEMFREFKEAALRIWETNKDVQCPTDFTSDPHFKLRDIWARLTMIDDAGLMPELPREAGRPDIMNEEPSSFKPIHMSELFRLSQVADCLFPLAESVVALTDMINPMLFRKTMTLDSSKGFNVILDDGRSIDPSMLSSGEKQLLLMLYSLMFEAVPGGVVIIDEPEISLHITWQQCIASLFLSIARTRGLQLLMATHSPQVVHDRWDLTVELVV